MNKKIVICVCYPLFAMSLSSSYSSDETISCRICLGDKSDGRFISPCRCNGTMKYVHDHCLQQWRMSSKNPNSFFQCDQCKHNYSFRKSWLIDLLKNDYLVYFLTALLFVTICVLCIYFSQWICITPYKGEPSLVLSISITFHVLLRIIFQSPHVRGTLFINVVCKLVLFYSIYKTYKLVDYLVNTQNLIHYIISNCLSDKEYRIENVS